MTEPGTRPVRLAAVDAMIARAKSACEPGRAALETYPSSRRTQRAMLSARQQAMEDAFARLRAKRADMGG